MPCATPLRADWVGPGQGRRRQRCYAAAFRTLSPAPALVLAAGASRRFGASKALARYGDQSLLDQAIGQALRLSTDVRVVTGCRGPLLRLRACRRPTSWLFTEHWPEGMSASLKQGLETLPRTAAGRVPRPAFRSVSLPARCRGAAPGAAGRGPRQAFPR